MIAARTRRWARAVRGARAPHTAAAATGAVLVTASLLCAPGARGAFAGTDGAIAYVVSNGITPYRLGSSYVTGTPNGTPLAESEADRGGDSFSPAWAPDGRDLAFASRRSGTSQIYALHLSFAGRPLRSCGAEVCRLTDDHWNDASPSWSPDGRELVFESNRSGAEQLYTVSAAGGTARRLLSDDAEDTQPAWSSTGLIAFRSNRSGSEQIYVMNARGGEVRQVTHQPGVNEDPSWSPDGTELAYAGGAEGQIQVFAIGLRGGPARQLTHDVPGDNELPAFSPDGTALLVSHRDPATNFGYVYAIDARSGNPIPGERLAGFEGTWAPLPTPPTGATPSQTSEPTAIARPLSGVVTVDPGQAASAGAAPTAQIPTAEAPAGRPTLLRNAVEIAVDAIYDATRGAVRLEVSTGTAARPRVAWAVIAGGRFAVRQSHPYATPIVQLLGGPRGCGRGLASTARRRSEPHVRLHTKGPWEAKDHFGRAAAKGTVWEVADTCRGALYRALRDDITVTDPGRHRTIVLTAGHSYLVRPHRGRRRRGRR
jgi:hypothetical protein